MLRDLTRPDNSDRTDMCERHIVGLLAATIKVGTFRRYEIAAHCNAIEIARDRLSALLDKAEGK